MLCILTCEMWPMQKKAWLSREMLSFFSDYVCYIFMSLDWTPPENISINKNTYAMSHFNQSCILKADDNNLDLYSIINADCISKSRCVHKSIYIITLTMLTISSHIFSWAFAGIVSNEVCTYPTISARLSFTFIYIWI